MKFRKRVKLGLFNLNVSRSGVGVSAGVPGLRVGVNSRGKAYRSVGLPGTGLSSRKSFTTDESQNGDPYSQHKSVNLLGFDYPVDAYRESNAKGCTKVLLWGISILLIPLGIGVVTTAFLYFQGKAKAKRPENKFKGAFTNGVVSASLGRFEQAIPQLQLALSIVPDDIYTVDLLGVCLFLTKRYEDSLLYFRELNDRAPTIRTKQLLAGAYQTIENPADYQQVIDLNIEMYEEDPLDTNRAFWAAYYLAKLDLFDKAIVYFQKVKEGDQYYTESLNLMAGCFYEKGDLSTALAALQKAPLRKSNLNDALIETHYLLGAFYAEQGDDQKAIKHLTKVVADNFSYKDARERLQGLKSA